MNGGVLSMLVLLLSLVLALCAGAGIPARVSLGWFAVAAFVGASILMRFGL